MRIQWDEEAAEMVIPPCFEGNTDDFKTGLKVIGLAAVARSNRDTGMTWVNTAGKVIYLEVIETWEKDELVALIRLPQPKES